MCPYGQIVRLHMSDRDDTRDTRDNTRECGSMFDPRAERADTHTRGAPTAKNDFLLQDC